jgi:Domain of unknown function (DUF4114)
MKTFNWLALLIFLSTLNACKKEVTRDVKFTNTEYTNLGTFDSSGKPDNLAPPDVIDPSLTTFMNANLISGQNLNILHPELFTDAGVADIAITQPSDVYITFVFEGASFSNAIAFYTYPSDQPPASADDIKLITYAFPNAGYQTPLKPGDKVKIGRFNPGTTIGFLIMENAWNRTTGTLNDNVVHFCSNDVLNPEVDPKLKRHAVLIYDAAENKNLISFEDTNRTDKKCDNDFNDVVMYVTVTP